MPVRPSVRWFESRQAYFCQIDGKQYRLGDGPDESAQRGPHFLRARAAFTQLLEQGTIAAARDRMPVRAVLDAYMQKMRETKRLADTTFRRRVKLFAPFAERLGDVAVGDLTPQAVNDFLAAMRRPRNVPKARRSTTWGNTSGDLFLRCLSAAFVWAKEEAKLIDTNPVAGMRHPPTTGRGRKLLVSPQEHARVLAALTTHNLREIVVALENTGARPSELCAATAAAWDEESCTFSRRARISSILFRVRSCPSAGISSSHTQKNSFVGA